MEILNFPCTFWDLQNIISKLDVDLNHFATEAKKIDCMYTVSKILSFFLKAGYRGTSKLELHYMRNTLKISSIAHGHRQILYIQILNNVSGSKLSKTLKSM